MLALAARPMGYGVHVFSPERDSPAGRVADHEWSAPYGDLDAARRFARGVDVVTLEFENIPAETVEEISSWRPSGRPAGAPTTQNRLREKEFLRGAGFPVAPFRAVPDRASLDAAVGEVGVPAVLKTAGFGYDGKGQTRISAPEDAGAAWEALGGEAVLEAWVDFEMELSVVAARGLDGSFEHYGAVRNTHSRHILDLTVAPAGVPPGWNGRPSR
jgi:5-(carboxyamino)imidazole ribonucleotide synthase